MITYNGIEKEYELFPNRELKIKDGLFLHENFNVTYRWWEGSEGFMQFLFFCYDFKHLHKGQSTLYLPYLPYSRMDRRVPGQAFTLPIVAKLINDLGFDAVYIGEPHSDVGPALINNSWSVPITQVLLSNYIHELKGVVSHAIVLPDAGAAKRYKLKSLPVVMGRKKRDPETGELSGFAVSMEEDAHKANRFIIIDDLCSRGGTFIGIADALEEALGRKPEIVLIVAHTEYAFFDGKIPHDDRFTQVITTDALIDPSKLHGQWTCDKLKVVNADQFEL